MAQMRFTPEQEEKLQSHAHQPSQRVHTFRDETHPDHTAFYVSAFLSGRSILLAGPYNTHDEALGRVEDVRAYAIDNSPHGVWASYGTASSTEIYQTRLGDF